MKFARYFLVAFLLTFPFQIHALVYSLPIFKTGEFDFYSSFFVYFSDLCFVAAFLCWAVSLWRKQTSAEFHVGDERLTFLFLALLLVMVGNAFFVAAPELHFFMTFRYIELFLLYLMVVNKVLSWQQTIFCLLFGFCFQSIIALYQYVLQSSIGLKFLGEIQANVATLGVAKMDVGGQKILRAFGTLPHANVLGGLLFMGILYSILLLKKYRLFVVGVLVLMMMGLLFTFSRTAFFALIGAFLVYISVQRGKIGLKYIFLAVSLLVFFIIIFRLEGVVMNRLLLDDPAALQERAMYLKMSRDMFVDQPLGVGLGGFTLHMQDYTDAKLVPWLYQPVHNIFLLMINELGVAGGALFCIIFLYSFYGLIKIINKQKHPDQRFRVILFLATLSGIVIIGCFDHYFVTIYAGQVMLFIYFGFVSSLLNSERLPSKNS